MNITHLQLFVRLASTYNISQAGQALNLSPAVASSYINKLEQGLGVRLVHRTTRKVALTEEGKAFLPHAQEVLASVDAAKAAVGAGCALPSGVLRVTAPASFGRMHLVPKLNTFLARYPDLQIDLRLTDSIVDLVEGGFDVAIRNAYLKDSSLIARKLIEDQRIVCAAPSYLAKYGEPKTPQDLLDHYGIHLAGLEIWVFDTPNGLVNIKTKARLRTDNGEAVRDACISGLGITVNSLWSAHKYLQTGQLVQILANYPLLSETAIWAVYPSSRLLAPKVRVFIDYLSECYAEAEWSVQGKE